ncbi:type I toxin-antitoxin system Fst family toxin [Butyricicoccus sp.]
MDVLISFLTATAAGIIAGIAVHMICKWLDNRHGD